jgi:hypothetical protein
MQNNIKETVAKLKKIGEGHLGAMADRVELDHEVQLARGQLYKIAKYAIKLHEAFKDVSEVQGLDGWVSAKITEASLAMDDVAHYMEYELSPANVANESVKEKVTELHPHPGKKWIDPDKEWIDPDTGKEWTNPDIIDRLTVDNEMERDPFGIYFTRGLDSEFSKRVADQNRKAKTSQGSNGPTTSGGTFRKDLTDEPKSKYSDWSK